MAHSFDIQLERSLCELAEEGAPVGRLPRVSSIKSAIEGGLLFGVYAQKDISRYLGVSVRTLQRRLKEEGLVYSDLLDSARINLLGQILYQGASISDASAKLHFKSRGSLNELLIRRLGMTAKEYQTKLLAPLQ